MFSKVENKSQWKDLLDKALFKTFFHSPEWESFLEKEFSWLKFERYIWRGELLLSIARCRMFGREKIVSHPLCEYGGPLSLKNQVDLAGFIYDFKKEFGENARIKFHPYITKYNRGLTPPKAGSDPRIVTFCIENFSKKTPQDLRQGFRKTLRQEIKKAAAGDISVGECAGKNELKQFYMLYLATVKRHKNIPLPFSFFQFFKGDEKAAKILLVKRNGEVVGGSVFLFYKPFIHYFISASDQRLRELNTGHAILWHVMQKYAGGEYDYFDLGGTRKGSVLEVFKRGWGAKEYPIYAIGAGNNTDKASFARNLLGTLPVFILKHMCKSALWLKA